MTERYPVADAEELSEDGSRVIAEIKGQEIAVFRHRGEYYALANYCVHQAGPLCEGALSGDIDTGDDGWDWVYDDEEKYIVCPWHGWMFDITTGRSPKDERYAVPAYDVEVEDGTVYAVR
jgi:nitrite reductase/ring-hydroxylating ferredoxin subunit